MILQGDPCIVFCYVFGYNYLCSLCSAVHSTCRFCSQCTSVPQSLCGGCCGECKSSLNHCHAARPILLYLFRTGACLYLTDIKLPSAVLVKIANDLHHNLVCRWPKERQLQKGRISQPRRSRLALLLQPMVHLALAVLQPAVLQLPVKAPRSEEDRQTRRCVEVFLKLSSSRASVTYSRDTCPDHSTTGQALQAGVHNTSQSCCLLWSWLCTLGLLSYTMYQVRCSPGFWTAFAM